MTSHRLSFYLCDCDSRAARGYQTRHEDEDEDEMLAGGRGGAKLRQGGGPSRPSCVNGVIKCG